MTLEDEVMAPKQHLIPPGAATTVPSIIPPGPAPPLQFDDTSGTSDSTFTVLALIDHKLHEWTKNISTLVEGLDAQGAQDNVQKMLGDQLLWLLENKKDIAHLDTAGDEANELLCVELTRNIDHVHAAVTSIKMTLEARTPEDGDQKSNAGEIIHTGKIPSEVEIFPSVTHY